MSQVKEIMTENPACCTPDTPVREVARMMVEHDCGEIPVVQDQQSRKPVGVVTDRDICCRVVAEGKDPKETTADDCMTTPCVTVSADADVDECCRVMEEKQIRRVPVVDESGRCCGIVAQADLATKRSGERAAGVVEQVSQPNEHASRV